MALSPISAARKQMNMMPSAVRAGLDLVEAVPKHPARPTLLQLSKVAVRQEANGSLRGGTINENLVSCYFKVAAIFV
jgi:hypothetical protein